MQIHAVVQYSLVENKSNQLVLELTQSISLVLLQTQKKNEEEFTLKSKYYYSKR